MFLLPTYLKEYKNNKNKVANQHTDFGDEVEIKLTNNLLKIIIKSITENLACWKFTRQNNNNLLCLQNLCNHRLLI